MSNYEQALNFIRNNGVEKTDRTGVGTYSYFGYQFKYNLSKEFPLITTKKVNWRAAFEELRWFLQGSTNIRPLLERNVHIWTEWPYKEYVNKTSNKENLSIKDFERRILSDESFAQEYGDLGPVYGAQWRHWKDVDNKEIDQLSVLIHNLKNKPDDRGLIISGWNVSDLNKMALRPCHTLYQWNVVNGQLDCQLYQRSADIFLGVPFNMISASLWTHLLCLETNLIPGDFVHTFGDLHIYKNHIEAVDLQLSRKEKSQPILKISKDIKSIWDFINYSGKIEDIVCIENYDPHPFIKAEVAV